MAKIDILRPVPSDVKQQKGMPDFKAFSKDWLKSNATRWDEMTSERYEAILRLHIWPYGCFNKPIDAVFRSDIKNHLRQIFQKRSSATVEAVHSVISGIFGEAIDDGKLRAIRLPGCSKKSCRLKIAAMKRIPIRSRVTKGIYS